ncbi:MAG: N-acetylmuramoyl-L-alanine amidase [Solirubrobacteraceae bacterium]|nr:N-acetylmuramoyl-L-alanine amidase [Solirubrobacteraceae bacterium]
MPPPSGRVSAPLAVVVAGALAIVTAGCGADAVDPVESPRTAAASATGTTPTSATTGTTPASVATGATPTSATTGTTAASSTHRPRAGRDGATAATTAATTTATSPATDPPAATTTTTTDATPLRGATVVVDPGHNGANARHPGRINRLVPSGTGRKACNTTGTQSVTGMTESRFNWLLAGHVVRALRAKGATVVTTRRSDRGVGPCVNRRAAIANAAKADASVSIHADGGPSTGRGFHVILPGPVAQVRGHDRIVAPSRRLGVAVRDAYRRGSGMPHATYLGRAGLDTRTDLGGLNLLRVPGVMIETGNMRNATDARRMADPRWRRRAGRAIARGVERFLLAQR